MLTALTSVLALVAGGLYLHGRGLQAQTETARLESQSRQVALEAQSLRADDLNLMGQMSLVAAELADTRQAVSTLLDATSLNVPLRWRGNGSAVIARSPDSSIVARADGTGGVTVWRGEELIRSRGSVFQADPERRALYAVALTARNGRLLLAVGGAAAAQLWDVTTEPRLIQELGDRTDTVKGLCFDAEGRTLAVATSSGAVAMWDITDAGQARRLAEVRLNATGAAAPQEAVSVALADGFLFVAGLPNAVARWSIADRTRPRRLRDLGIDYKDRVNTLSLAVNPQGTQLSAGIRGRRIFRWSLAGATASPLQHLQVDGWTNDLAYSADGHTLLAGNADQNVYVFATESGQLQTRLFDAHSVTGVEWVAGRTVSVGDDGTLRVWQSRTPVNSAGSPVYSLSADGGDRFVAAATLNHGILLWRRDGQRMAPLPAPDDLGRATSAAVAVAPNGAFAVGGTSWRHGELLSWPLTEAGAGAARVVRAFPSGGYVGALAISPDSTLVAALEYTGKHIALFRAGSSGELKPLSMLDSPVPQAVSFSPDGRLLAVPLASDVVQLWDVSNPRAPTLAGEVPSSGSPAFAAALSPVGNRLAVGTGAGDVTVWDVSNPRSPVKIRTLRGPMAALTMVAFSPDSSMLAAGGGDRYIWLWSLDDAGDDAYLALASASVRTWDLRFLDGGRQLIAGGESGELRSWLLVPGEARQVLCANRGDPLSAEEWARYLPGIAVNDPC